MDRVTGLFPLWAVLISAAAVVYPAPLIPLKWAIVPLLGVVMFGMGVTLTPGDFAAIMKRPVIIAVVLHNLLGLASGYAVPKALGLDPTICRTIAIEVGMQNSGLAVALAIKYFSPAAALPGALFSIWHNLSGAALAGFWSRPSRPR